MKIHLAIVDDDIAFIEYITKKIQVIGNSLGHTVDVDTYSSSLCFQREYKTKSDFDALLFDIQMPKPDGIDLAKSIRVYNKTVPIIFISDHSQFSVTGYEVNASRFLVKHAENFDDKLSEALNFIAISIEITNDEVYEINTARKKARIAFTDIAYFEASNHDLIVHTIHNEEIKERKTISALAEELPKHFAMTSRSFIVNLKHVREVNTNALLLINGITVPLTRSYKDDFMKAYFNTH